MTSLLLGSWVVSGLAAAATARTPAPAPEAGTYRITSVASDTSLRAYRAGEAVFVSSTRENPGPFELWEIARTGNGYTIKNVGLGLVGQPGYAEVRQTSAGDPVVTGDTPTTWSIEAAGGGTHVIKVPAEDLLWNVEPPVVPRGDVRLRQANGSDVQRWRLTPVSG
ncbi:RICIN domain-containing protein [Nonomuraea longicatena]|uniref:Ricin B lectin domain-containing protein n=1 Tax=Nonomuraea longicatena TaxID=83682 RepID=A0ABP4B026_9ACTN